MGCVTGWIFFWAYFLSLKGPLMFVSLSPLKSGLFCGCLWVTGWLTPSGWFVFGGVLWGGGWMLEAGGCFAAYRTPSCTLRGSLRHIWVT